MPKEYVESKNGYLVGRRIDKYNYVIFVYTDNVNIIATFCDGNFKFMQVSINEIILWHLNDLVTRIHANEIN